MRAPMEQPYRSTKFPAVPNRLRIFAGTSNPVSCLPALVRINCHSFAFMPAARHMVRDQHISAILILGATEHQFTPLA